MRECLAELLPRLVEGQFLLSEDSIREAAKSQRQSQLIDLISTFKLDLYPKELVAGYLDRVLDTLSVRGTENSKDERSRSSPVRVPN